MAAGAAQSWRAGRDFRSWRKRKLFTAERQRLARRGGQAEAAAPSVPAQGMGEVLAAIESLREEVRELRQHVIPQEQKDAEAAEARAAEAEALEQQAAEVNLLRTELRALAVCIEQTKVEIASLRPPGGDDDRLMVVANELDAIVNATETATQRILDAAEHIDNLADGIQAQEKDSYIRHMADDVREHIVAIFEACNFQDITGQRITKVVNTLKFVEDRVNAMIDIWGPDSFSALDRPADVDEDDEKKLLNGPQLENQGISQDDIDKLFD